MNVSRNSKMATARTGQAAAASRHASRRARGSSLIDWNDCSGTARLADVVDPVPDPRSRPAASPPAGRRTASGYNNPSRSATIATGRKSHRINVFYVSVIFLMLVSVWVFFDSFVSTLVWTAWVVAMILVLSLSGFGVYAAMRKAREMRRASKPVHSMFIMIVVLPVLAAGIGAYGVRSIHAYQANTAETELLIREGLGNLLEPHRDHYEFRYRDGSVLYFEPTRLVTAEEVSESAVGDGIVAIEDERLFSRKEGVIDVRSVARSIKEKLQDLFAGRQRRMQGASTLTQQIAKMLRGKKRNEDVGEKIYEAILAQRIADEFTAEEQLALYVNLCEIVGDVRGIPAAAFELFGITDLRSLSNEQAGLLAGMARSPSQFNPRSNPDQAKSRRNTVLGKMRDLDFIAPDECERAQAAPIEVKKAGWTSEPSFLNAVRVGGFR